MPFVFAAGAYTGGIAIFYFLVKEAFRKPYFPEAVLQFLTIIHGTAGL